MCKGLAKWKNDFQNWAHTKSHERLLKRDSWFSESQLELRNLQAPWWCWWPIDHTLGNTRLEETKADFRPILASFLPRTLEDDLSPTPRLGKIGALPFLTSALQSVSCISPNTVIVPKAGWWPIRAPMDAGKGIFFPSLQDLRYYGLRDSEATHIYFIAIWEETV